MKPLKESVYLMMGGLTCALLSICAAGVQAQDPVKVSPDHFKVVLENDRVRVLDFHSKTGDKVPMHSHPAYVSYGLSGSGKTKFTAPDGKTTEQEVSTGKALWHDAETHASEYQGPGGTHVLLIELKGATGK